MADDKDNSELDTAKTNLIVSEPAHFYSAQQKTLESRIAEIAVPEDRIEEILASKSGKVIRDAILGTFSIGRIAKTILDWNEGVDKEIKEAKKTHLLERYFNVSDQNEKSVSELKSLIYQFRG